MIYIEGMGPAEMEAYAKNHSYIDHMNFLDGINRVLTSISQSHTSDAKSVYIGSIVKDLADIFRNAVEGGYGYIAIHNDDGTYTDQYREQLQKQESEARANMKAINDRRVAQAAKDRVQNKLKMEEAQNNIKMQEQKVSDNTMNDRVINATSVDVQ